MTEPARRQSRTSTLTRDEILREALLLLDEHGAAAFSLRRLAARLRVDPMTIYWHIKGKDEILDGVVAVVFARVRPAQDGPWHERVADAVREHRRVLRAHPAVLDVLLTRPARSSAAWAGAEQAIELLTAEVGPEPAGRWFRLLTSFANGFVLTERPAAVEHRKQIVERLGDDAPALAATLAALDRHADADFERGLGVLIAALRQDRAVIAKEGARP